MSDVYDQHEASFRRVAAHAVMRGGELVAKVAIKFPADGALRNAGFHVRQIV